MFHEMYKVCPHVALGVCIQTIKLKSDATENRKSSSMQSQNIYSISTDNSAYRFSHKFAEFANPS